MVGSWVVVWCILNVKEGGFGYVSSVHISLVGFVAIIKGLVEELVECGVEVFLNFLKMLLGLMFHVSES